MMFIYTGDTFEEVGLGFRGEAKLLRFGGAYEKILSMEYTGLLSWNKAFGHSVHE